MKKMYPFGVLLALAAALAGCGTMGLPSLSQVTTGLTNFNAAVGRIAPVVGKDVILLGDALVQIECSPAVQLATQGVTAAIAVTGTSSTTATKAVSYLQGNAQIAAALCPVYQGIKQSIVAQVGALPTSTPSQSIPVPVKAAS